MDNTTTHKEVLMANNSTDHDFDRDNRRSTAKAVFVLLALAAVGYLAMGTGGNSRHLHDGVSAPATASQMSYAYSKDADSAEGVMAKSATPAPRDFDYFPDHFVNQATKVEEPSSTF
jgi:hypothetical protein